MNKKIIAGMLLSIAILATAQASYAEEIKAKKEEKKDVKSASIIVPANPATSVEIGSNGKASVSDAKVTAINGSVLTATTAWGGFTLTWTVQTNSSTNFNARYGGNLNISNISVGDRISFKGSVTGGGPTVLASVVTNLSMQRRNATFLGTVTSINSGAQSFVVNTKERGSQTVFVSSSTKFLGTLNSFSALTVGAKVQASGIWNSDQNSLQAAHVLISKEKQNEERVFQGTIKSISATTTPATIVARIEGADRTITLAADTSILNFRWERIPLTSFRVGDTVRVYGIGQDFSIGATVVRNVSL